MPTAQTTRLAAVDAYIARAAPFARPILTHLRELVHAAVPEVEEAIKWSKPFFVYRGIILVHMAAFKAHCSLGVWKEEVQGLMKPSTKQPSADKVHRVSDGMGSFGKLVSLADLPSDKDLAALLREAAAKIDRGDRTKNWRGRARRERPLPELPEALETALRTHTQAATRYAAMSPSCQREYCDWIDEAKREETREKRVREALAMITEGKGRNWKYEASR